MLTIEIIETTYQDVLDMIKDVPEFARPPAPEEVEKRCGNVPYLALITKHQDIPVGCKLGYRLTDKTFYSWIGGVLPEYRNRGIAQKLLDYQEKWVRRRGYTVIRVKSMNRYPDMLRFLIRNKYQITGLEGNEPEHLKVVFEKFLKETGGTNDLHVMP